MFEPITAKPDYSQPSPTVDSWANLGPGKGNLDPLEPVKQRAIIDAQFETVSPEDSINETVLPDEVSELDTTDGSIDDETEELAAIPSDGTDTVDISPESEPELTELSPEELTYDPINPAEFQSGEEQTDTTIKDNDKSGEDPRNQYDASNSESTPSPDAYTRELQEIEIPESLLRITTPEQQSTSIDYYLDDLNSVISLSAEDILQIKQEMQNFDRNQDELLVYINIFKNHPDIAVKIAARIIKDGLVGETIEQFLAKAKDKPELAKFVTLAEHVATVYKSAVLIESLTKNTRLSEAINKLPPEEQAKAISELTGEEELSDPKETPDAPSLEKFNAFAIELIGQIYDKYRNSIQLNLSGHVTKEVMRAYISLLWELQNGKEVSEELIKEHLNPLVQDPELNISGEIETPNYHFSIKTEQQRIVVGGFAIIQR